MNCQCEECKFANWDYRMFADYVRLQFSVQYYSEQFDFYCSLLNKFFLENEISGNCSKYEYGENNYHNICKQYYFQKQKYINWIKKFREKLDNDMLTGTYEEFELFLDYLKKNDPELYEVTRGCGMEMH